MIQEDTGISEILTRAEAAAFIRVSEKTLGEMARTRRIHHRRSGGSGAFYVAHSKIGWLEKAFEMTID